MHTIKSQGKEYKFENCHDGYNAVVTLIELGAGNNADRCYRSHCPYCGYFCVDETVREVNERWQDRMHNDGNRPNKFTLKPVGAAVQKAVLELSSTEVMN